MLPVYYTSVELTKLEVNLAKQSWDYMTEDIFPVYISNLSTMTFAHAFPSCKDWFSELFYERLFDVHPVSITRNLKNIYTLIFVLRSFFNIFPRLHSCVNQCLRA